MGEEATRGLDWAGLPVIALWRGYRAHTQRYPGH
jgi:hypothetical protein